MAITSYPESRGSAWSIIILDCTVKNGQLQNTLPRFE